ncbi:hypothetical protein PR048_008859 [Dryococelus australis]|uniref:Uncharacterized protein n=1 Tax=Dryococelus australis TaxID=614101 RepID=A0ABQ9HZC4_9NEOP|nr:hypothetical protein PR048_008859 [Dryococelus australis]
MSVRGVDEWTSDWSSSNRRRASGERSDQREENLRLRASAERIVRLAGWTVGLDADARAGKMEDSRKKNLPASGIFRHDTHMRESEDNPADNRTGFAQCVAICRLLATGFCGCNGAWNIASGGTNGGASYSPTNSASACSTLHGHIRAWHHSDSHLAESYIVHRHTRPAPRVTVSGAIRLQSH